MSQWWKAIRDKLQRAVFNQQLAVLRTLEDKRAKGDGRPMTYGEVSFAAGRGKVSTDNALAILDAMSIEMQPGEWLVDRPLERDGVEGTYFRINHRGRKWLEQWKVKN